MAPRGRFCLLSSVFCHLSRLAPRAKQPHLYCMPPLVHLAIAQMKPAKGDYAANLARLGEVFAQVDDAGGVPLPALAACRFAPARLPTCSE